MQEKMPNNSTNDDILGFDTLQQEQPLELIDIIASVDDAVLTREYDLKNLLLQSDPLELLDVIESAYVIDVAIALENFEDDEILAFYQKIDNEHMAQVLEQADEDLQLKIIELLDFKSLLLIFHYMSNDDIADILGNMPINIRKDILKTMKSKDTIEIQNLLLYAEDTAGGLMTTEYIALNQKLTLNMALNKIREIGAKTEVIETIFVLNEKKKLVGTADLRDILSEDETLTLEDIMYDSVISVTPDMDQEEVSHLVSKYDLKALPVINRKGSLLGIITVDDVIDVLFEEQTEDILKMGGVSGDETTENSVLKSVKLRLPWLIVNLGTAFIASFVVRVFEGTIAQVTALAAAMPIIAGMGGNAGSQTLSLIIRSITLGEINLKNDWKLVFKELFIGLADGAVTGLIAGAFLALAYQNIYLGFIVLIAMMCNIIISAFFGFFIPLTLKAIGVDPALASSIFLTTATDVCGFLAFLGLATIMLPLLL